MGSQNLIYCFHIKLQDGTNLCLTDSDKAVTIDEMIFSSVSGVSLKEGIFNDSGHDHIILEGIFELGGIEKEMDLTAAQVKILIYFSGDYYHFITYSCSIYTKYDLNFEIFLEPPTKAYNQSLLQSFSKTCRANFGDTKCKVDKVLYSAVYKVKEIFDKTLIILNMDKEDGYFNDGDAIFCSQFQGKIISQPQHSIILDKSIPNNVKDHQNIKLIIGCDKNFITCCNKFNNAVNFRGEPLIPDDNFIKVNFRNFKII